MQVQISLVSCFYSATLNTFIAAENELFYDMKLLCGSDPTAPPIRCHKVIIFARWPLWQQPMLVPINNLTDIRYGEVTIIIHLF